MPIPPLPLFRHRDTVVTPADQNQFVTQFETTMDTMSNDVIPAINLAITDINAKTITATTARDESEDARDIAVAAKDEALTAVATLQEGAIDNTIIAPNKAFSNQYVENNYYDKAETYNKTEVDTAISEATLDINNLTDKPTPVDTDNFVLQEVGGDLKKVSFQNLTKLSPNDSRVKTALNASGNAPIYACRAYGYANHVTNTLINGSGISSITDAGVGQIYFNLVVPSPDIKYTVLATVGGSIAGSGSIQPSIVTYQKTTNQFDVVTTGATTYNYTDNTQVYVAVFY